MNSSSAREAINQKLADFSSEMLDVEEFSLSYFSPIFTLIPNAIFQGNSSEEFLKYAFELDIDNRDIDYNRIPELTLVNVFEIPTWIKNLFVIKFPRIVIQHEISNQLRGIFNSSTFKLKIHVVLYVDYFLLTISKENNLILCNTYEYQNSDDILYQLTNALIQMNIHQERGECILSDTLKIQSSIVSEIQDKAKSISNLSQLQFSLKENFSFNNQKLCV